MASEVKLPESVLEEKKASPEVIDIQAINNLISTQNIKEQLEIKSSVVDENIANEDVDLIKEDITEKPETLEEKLKESQEEQKYAETINGETENGVNSNKFTEELPPEVIKADEIPVNGTSLSSEEIQEKSEKELLNVEKIESEEVSKEDAPQSQVQENAEISVKDAQQDITTSSVTEEVSAQAKGKNDVLEEVEQEQIHQTEVAKENLAEEEFKDETKDESRGVSEILTKEETISEEASLENQAPEMISEETAINEEIIPHEDSTSYNSPITNEEDIKNNEETMHLSEEVKKIDVPIMVTPLILEEGKESAEINEETKEAAQQNQDSEGNEIEKEASESTPVTDLSGKEHQNETEKEMENASSDTEEQIMEKADSKEVESASASEQVLEEEKKENVTEEKVQKEQAADECAEEECPPDAGIENSDAAELVVSEGTVPEEEEAVPESKISPNPEMQISEEVIPTEDIIGVSEKDETSKNDKESAVENAVSRDVTPEIQITDAEKTVIAETDNTDIKEIVKEDAEKKIETNDEQEIKSCLETEEQLDQETKPSTSEEELSSEKVTTETEPIEEKEDEEIVAQDEIALDSKESVGNDDEAANRDVKDEETREINLAEEQHAEANKENIEEIPEPNKPRDNTEDSTTAELPKEEIQLETENDVSSELVKGEEVIPETPSESTMLSEMENIEHKVNDSERDDTQAGSSHETNEVKEDEKVYTAEPDETVQSFEVDEKPEEILSGNVVNETTPTIKNEEIPPEKDENINNEITEEVKEDEKNNTDEPDEMVQNLEIDEKPEEILSGDTVNETTSSIQNEEDPPEKDESINNEITEEEHITEVNASTVVTEVPAEELQNSIGERSYELDQSIPETASEQDNLPIASVGSEIESEKPEIGNASSQGEANSVIPETDDKSELELESKEKSEEETLIHEEVTQKVEAVEEELPEEEESTIVHEKTSIEPNISVIQQDQQIEESDATPIEAHNATDDISVEQTDERSIDKEGTTIVQDEDDVEAPNEEAEMAEELKESTEQIDQRSDPSNVAEVELSQIETVAPETEISEDSPTEKLEDESNSKEIDAKPAELEDTAEKSTEQEEEVSTEPSNTRELQINQTEIIAEQDQPSEESEVKPTELDQATEDVLTVENSEVDATVSESVLEVENSEVIGESGASVERIEGVSVDKEESVALQEEDVAVPEEEGQKIEAENEKHIDEDPQVTTPSEVTEVKLNQTETIPPETENLEAVSNEVLGDDNKLAGTDIKLAESESATGEPSEEKEIPTEPSNTRELQVDQAEIIGIAEQDQLSEEKEIKPTEPDQATEDVPTVENSKVDATVSESVSEVENSEVIGESGASVEKIEDVTFDKEESVVLQKDDAAVPKEEAQKIEAEKEKHTEDDPEVTAPSEVTEVELNQTETVPLEIKILEAVSNEELGDENKLAGTNIKLAKSESTTKEPIEEKEISAEPNNTRELQVDQAEIIGITEQDKPSKESEVKPTEPDQEIKDVPTMENLEVDATVSESVSEVENSEVIGESGVSVERIEDVLVDKDESVVLQEEDVAAAEEEGQKIKAENEKHIEEDPQITTPSEVNQTETVPPETKNLEVVSNEVLGDENKLAGTDTKLAESESVIEEPSKEKEVPNESNNTRELQVDQAEIVAEQDQPSEELEVKPIKLAKEESVEEIGEGSVATEESVLLQEEGVAVEMPEEEVAKENQIEEKVPQISNPSEVNDVVLKQSDIVPPETETLEAVSHEGIDDESKLTGSDIKLAEFESATEEPSEEKEISNEPTNRRELLVNQAEILAEQDQPSEEVPTMKNSEVDATVSESVEEIGEGSVAKEESVVLQEEDVAIEMPEEEATKEKQIEEEVSQITNSSEVSEVKLNQSETISPETEILEAVPHETETNLEAVSSEELGDDNKLAGTDIKLAESESTTEEPSEEKEIPTEPNNARELQVDEAEIIAEQDQPSQESEVKSTELDQAIEEVPIVENLEVEAAMSESAEEIVESSVLKEKSVVLQQDAAAEMLEEEATNEKQIEEEVSQITNPSEVTEVELNQSETVPAATEILEADSNEKLGDENKLAGTYINLVKSKDTTEVPTEEKEILNEPSNTRELQIDQSEIIAEQDEPSQESDVKPAEPDQATEEVSAVEKSDIDATVTATVEESKEEVSVIFEEENVAVGMPAEEATNEKEIKPEVTEVIHPSEITEEHPADTDTEKVGDELNSDQMENYLLEESIKEKLDAGVSSGGAEQITEKSEESEVDAGMMINEETDRGVEAAEEEEPCEKHIEGEIHRTADPEIELKPKTTEKELDPQIFEPQAESPEEHKAIASLVANETQSVVESVIVAPEQKISQEIEKNEEVVPTTTDSKTCESTEVTVSNEKELALPVENSIPDEAQIEETEILNKENDVLVQNIPESVVQPEERISQEVEASEESSDKHITGEILRNVDTSEVFSTAEEPKVILTEEETDSQKPGNETELLNQEEKTEESTLMEEKSDELVAVPEEIVSQEAEATTIISNEAEVHSDKLITDGEGKVEEREIANEERDVAAETERTIESVTVTEERVYEGNETYDEPSDKHIVTEENVNEAGSTSVEEAVVNQTDNESKTVPVAEEINAEDEEAKGHTERDIDATVFLKAPEIAADEINEHTEETVHNISEQNKEIEEEADQSEAPEQDFASIVSSFLINKVLSDENQKIDDATEQTNITTTIIPKTSDEEMIQEVTTTKNEPETRDEDYIPDATNSTECLKPEQEQAQEEESTVKEVREDEQKDGVEQDYLPVSRFLMDKILRQEETKFPEKEAESIEEANKHVISDGGIKVQEEFEEINSTLVVAPPEQNVEKENNSINDGAIESEEKTEGTVSVEELLPKQGEENLSSKEVAGDFEKDENKSLVSDVVEQEGERSVSPAEVKRDYEKEDAMIEQKNEEKDETLVSKETSFTEDVEHLACGEENNKDLVVEEETVVNAPEISIPEKVKEEKLENQTVVMQKEEERRDEVIDEEETETPKDVKNVEENYVFVEHEVNQSEEVKEVLEGKVTEEVSDAAISNLKEEQTADSTANRLKIEQMIPDVPEVTTEIVKEHVGNETDDVIIRGEEQVKEVTGTVESSENKIQEKEKKSGEMEATKVEKKSKEIENEEQEEEDEEEQQEIIHQEREAEIISSDPTVNSEVKETETNKSAQKKSLNILSGVGLKVITFTKVKKAFTGKSFTKVKKAFTGKSKSASPSAK